MFASLLIALPLLACFVGLIVGMFCIAPTTVDHFADEREVGK